MTTVSNDERVRLRSATEEDVPFVAWVMLAASRSHLPRGIWEYLYDLDEARALAYLERLAVTDTVHLFHHSLFVVAEVGGQPAAAMCGYDPATQGFAQFGSALPEVAGAAGIALDDPELGRRTGVLMAGFVEPPVERAWIVENVATRPEFRRRGLVDALLAEVLDRGRAKGFDTGQIGVFIGNEPARRAYIKAGFDVVGEKRDAGWDTEIGCPGTELLLQPLT